jgi:hypothetical protein
MRPQNCLRTRRFSILEPVFKTQDVNVCLFSISLLFVCKMMDFGGFEELWNLLIDHLICSPGIFFKIVSLLSNWKKLIQEP